VAEGNGLLNRRRGKTSTEGSNPSLSATARETLPDERGQLGSLIFSERSCNSASLFLS
jgi:hypothetical protein